MFLDLLELKQVGKELVILVNPTKIVTIEPAVDNEEKHTTILLDTGDKITVAEEFTTIWEQLDTPDKR